MTNKHSPAQLSEGLEHVVYEIWKYKQSIADYGQILQAGGDAAIEFRIIHHRVLLEFFYGPPAHKDNLQAFEYVSDWQQSHNREKLLWLHAYMQRCHAMLAHLSSERIEIAKRGLKSWGQEWQKVEPHLDQVTDDFLGSISPEHKLICLRWIESWKSLPTGKILERLAPSPGKDRTDYPHTS